MCRQSLNPANATASYAMMCCQNGGTIMGSSRPETVFIVDRHAQRTLRAEDFANRAFVQRAYDLSALQAENTRPSALLTPEPGQAENRMGSLSGPDQYSVKPVINLGRVAP